MNHLKKDINTDYIKRKVATIEMVMESFGKRVRVMEVNIKDDFILFDIEWALGTRISEIVGLNNDLASALSSPTGKVEIYPLVGTSLIEIKVPVGKTKLKEEKYKIIRVEVESPKLSDWARIKTIFGTILLIIGDVFYWLSKKVAGSLK